MLIPDSLTPEEKLVLGAQKGDQLAFVALLTKYTPLIRLKASRFYKCGYDPEDFFQEGTLGLYNAVMTYNKNGGATFPTYAGICIDNRLVSAYKHASRKKHAPLENYLPLTSLDSFVGTFTQSNPEERFIEREDLLDVEKLLLDLCSETERKILSLYLRGFTYKKISSMLGITEKSVDNALQRIKRRLKRRLSLDNT